MSMFYSFEKEPVRIRGKINHKEITKYASRRGRFIQWSLNFGEKNIVILLFLLLKLPDLVWIFVFRNCLGLTKICQNKVLTQQSSWVPTSPVVKSNFEIRISTLVEKREQRFLLSSKVQVISREKQMSFAKSPHQSQKKHKSSLVHTNGTKKPNFKSVFYKMIWGAKCKAVRICGLETGQWGSWAGIGSMLTFRGIFSKQHRKNW